MLQDKLNKNPFTVPENYFDRFPMRMQERYAFTKNAKAGLGIWATIRPHLAYVGGFVALALLAYGGFSLAGDSNAPEKSAIANTKTRPVSVGSFINNNTKSYAQFTNTNPLIRIVDDNDAKSKSKIDMDEDIMNYLAAENISAEDILGFE
ncbi:MAG: hypothetical protein LBL90_04440 [Prevotellaceae bacterium]|jgi:hypothetical protein|nr:hypothetical protein [Prevotellaceae bacterium]